MRAILYVILWIFSVVLLGLTAARIHYTTHLDPLDPLNDGQSFYDPIVAELLVCSILAIVWSPLVYVCTFMIPLLQNYLSALFWRSYGLLWCMIHMIHGRREYKFLSLVWHELLGLAILWLLWLVGAAVATSIWPNLPSFCSQYNACRVLTAMVAFSWLGWITVTALVVTTLLYATANSSWADPAHGHWTREGSNPRMSEYSQYSVHA
ncbi:hypothetical protein A7U60_g2050 [Sanghuangporus baumii]|uniref:Uncharacterized protein n=1 Tax=Sanghuangporus baumii TaxID=108892 RepID=A0A9Q5N8J5_SANBA|nr:hypothetical protein A7U60_g2050 [Sanghuangporus baumii]